MFAVFEVDVDVDVDAHPGFVVGFFVGGVFGVVGPETIWTPVVLVFILCSTSGFDGDWDGEVISRFI